MISDTVCDPAVSIYAIHRCYGVPYMPLLYAALHQGDRNWMQLPPPAALQAAG